MVGVCILNDESNSEEAAALFPVKRKNRLLFG